MSRLYDILRKLCDVETETASITASTGSLLSSKVKKSGRVVHLELRVYNTALIAPGANIFEGTMDTEGLIPKNQTSGAAYYGGNSITAVFGTNGTIRVRNTGTANITPSSSSPIYIPFTYLA